MFAPAFLSALGAVGDAAAPLGVEAEIGGRRVRARLQPRAGGDADLAPMQRTKGQLELWADAAGAARAGNFVQRTGDAIVISCDDLGVEVAAFGDFTQSCFEAIDGAADARRLIVDLRRNGGGNNFLFEALRKRIARSRFNRPGGLYVLISPRTFSAAQNAANRLERETFATFIGEPTGGAPNHFGDAELHVGAATGITSLISTLPWFDSYPQDQRESILPDLPAPEMFADWRDGADSALQHALSDANNTQPNEWSGNSTFYFRRPSQSATWRPFWRPG